MQVRIPVETGSATLQGGRQLLAYGSERLIGLRFGPNVPQAFDGGLGRVEIGPWRADTFFMQPVENNLHDFDDRTDGSRKLWAFYATRSLPNINTSSGLDLFYIGNNNTMAEYKQGAGQETRHTIGSRFFGQRNNWKWDLESHFQFGAFGTGDILAWSVASNTRYTFADVVTGPRCRYRGCVLRVRAGAIH